MGKGALGLLSAYWPEMTARHAHVPLERAPQFTVHRSAKSDPDRPALVTAERSVSFAELSALVRAAGGTVIGTVQICDRLEAVVDLGVPNYALAEYQAPENHPAADCPMCRAGRPITSF